MEADQGGISPRPPSPEDVARAYIRQEGSFEIFEDPPSWFRRKWWFVAMAFVVAAGAAGAVVYFKGSAPSRTNDSPDGLVEAQVIANQLAVRAGCPANPKARVNNLSFAAPTRVIQPRTLYAVTVTTTAGTFRLGLNVIGTPKTLNSFVFLAQQGYFNCDTFFRVKTGIDDLTGDPTGTGNGTPGYKVPLEKPTHATNPADQYPLGSLALYNKGPADDGGSQWFIVAGRRGEALTAKYALFGHVISGLSVVEKINAEGSTAGQPKVIERILHVSIQTANG